MTDPTVPSPEDVPTFDAAAAKMARTLKTLPELQHWIDTLPRCEECGYAVSEMAKLAERRFHSAECSHG